MTTLSSAAMIPVDRSDYRLKRRRDVPYNRDEALDLSRVSLTLTDQRPVICEQWTWWQQLWATYFLPAAGLEELTPEQVSDYLLTHLPEPLHFHGKPGLVVFKDPKEHWGVSLTYRLLDMDLGR